MGNNEEYFEFREELELPEDLDYKNTKPCPHCKKPIPQNAVMCLYCGEAVYPKTHKKSWVMWVALFVIIAFLFLIVLR